MNIPLPQLPTDNLYKFIAIFGLISLILSLSAKIYYENELTKGIFIKEIEKAKLNYTIAIDSTVMLSYDLIFNDAMQIDKRMHYYINKNEYKHFVLDSLNYANKLIDSIFNDNKMIRSKLLNNAYEIKTIEKTKNDLIALKERISKISQIGLYFGILLCYLGFYCWYKNSQLYYDIKLKVELTNKFKTVDVLIEYKNGMKYFMLISLSIIIFFIGYTSSNGSFFNSSSLFLICMFLLIFFNLTSYYTNKKP